jgi:hypothetical protein
MSLHEDLAEKSAFQKAAMIDEHLKRFLYEEGLYNGEWNLDKMSAELTKAGFEIVHELQRLEESEIHTFKVCKVIKTTKLQILNKGFSIIPQ